MDMASSKLSTTFFPDALGTSPDLFAMQWDVVFEALALVIVIAFFLERVLALLFESHSYTRFRMQQRKKGRNSFKEIIALVASLAICLAYQIDFLAIILSYSQSSFIGIVLTAMLVAGGSKASLKLFRDVLNIRSSSYQEYVDFKNSDSADTTES